MPVMKTRRLPDKTSEKRAWTMGTKMYVDYSVLVWTKISHKLTRNEISKYAYRKRRFYASSDPFTVSRIKKDFALSRTLSLLILPSIVGDFFFMMVCTIYEGVRSMSDMKMCSNLSTKYRWHVPPSSSAQE